MQEQSFGMHETPPAIDPETGATNSTRSSQSAINEGKGIAVIAYLTLIGLIVAFVMNNDRKNSFAAFHIRQMLGLSVTGMALMIINVIPILGWLVSILGSVIMLVLWIIGLINAANGKEEPIPVLGEHYKKWFKGI